MKNEYAVRKADNVCMRNISTTGIYDAATEYIFRDDNDYRAHESGAPQYKLDGDVMRLMSTSEIQAQAEYITWHNAKIESQLRELDIKRIRPVAEISDDNTRSQDKQTAKATIKILDEQAAALRAQIIK